MLRRIALFPVLLLTVAAAGCIQTPSAPSAPADVTLITTDAAGLEAAIAAHKGKVVLVDYWATWCVPCIKAFPHTVALSRNYADKPFVAISVSVDTAEELAYYRNGGILPYVYREMLVRIEPSSKKN